MKKKSCLILIVAVIISFILSNIDFMYYLFTYEVRKEIKVVNAYNNNDAYHPKIIKFEKTWNNYKYWLTFTPLYKDDDQTENPHILVSNDLTNWTTIKGFTNPVEDKPIDGKRYNVYYSDPVLVYNHDNNELECWFRYINKQKKEVIIYRKKTSDGINFSEKSVVLKSFKSIDKIISPAVIYEDGKYKIWYVSNEKDENIILYTESADLIKFSKPRKIKIKYKEKDLITWHIDVSKINNKYHLLISAYKKDTNPTLRMNLFYCSSNDNNNYSKARIILMPRVTEKKFDSKSIYKSSLLYDNNEYYIVYSSISKKNDHRLGIVNITRFIK